MGFAQFRHSLTLMSITGLLLAPAARANDTSVTFTAGVPRLLNEKQISMQSEKLEFRYVQPTPMPMAKKEPLCPAGWYEDEGQCHTGHHWDADLTYTFVNHGPAKTLTIGLPFDMPDCSYESDINGPSLCDKEGVRSLTTALDGQNLKVMRSDVKVSQPIAFNRLYSVTVPFAAGQTRQLRHRYQSYNISSVQGQRFRYLLRTGSTWAGPIGKVEIAFELPPEHGPCATANLPHRFDGRWLRIGLSNWKPDRDLDIVFADRQSATYFQGIFDYDDVKGDICADLMDRPLADRRMLADQIELLYGAPALGREKAFALGPYPMCASSGYFSLIQDKEADFMPHPGLSGLRWISDLAYPGNMSSLLRQCLQRMRQSD